MLGRHERDVPLLCVVELSASLTIVSAAGECAAEGPTVLAQPKGDVPERIALQNMVALPDAALKLAPHM